MTSAKKSEIHLKKAENNSLSNQLGMLIQKTKKQKEAQHKVTFTVLLLIKRSKFLGKNVTQKK